MNIQVIPSDEIIKEAVEALDAELLKSQGKEMLFLSSGGSSLAMLEHINVSYFGSQSTITVLDERYSTDPTINNFSQLMKTNFYEKVLRNGSRFIDTRPKDNGSMENTAMRFEKELRDWMKKGDGIIIATIGVGPDAHTAGIMPYPEDKKLFEASFEGEQLVKGYNAGNKSPYPLRITVTMPFMRKINFAVSIIRGSDKKEAVSRLKSEKGSLHESPCRIIRELPHAEVFIEPPLQ